MARPFIIPIFLPNAGCRHHCAFCNQKTITGIQSQLPSSEEVQNIVREFLPYKGKDRGETYIAFYGGNFLGVDFSQMKGLLSAAALFVKEGQVKGIRMSTRPDTITEEALEVVSEYPVSTIELGVQSMDDRVLAACKRGHTAADTIKAVDRLKRADYAIGLQMMVGLPEDSEEGSLETARAMADLSPDFVRIYPAVVLKNSLLAKWYRQGLYEPLGLDECVTLVKKVYLLFKEQNIPVIRMGLQETEDLARDSAILAGPYHPAFGHLVYSEIFLDAAVDLLESKNLSVHSITLMVKPENVSVMRGLKNKNIEILKKRFSVNSINIIPDASMADDTFIALDY